MVIVLIDVTQTGTVVSLERRGLECSNLWGNIEYTLETLQRKKWYLNGYYGISVAWSKRVCRLSLERRLQCSDLSGNVEDLLEMFFRYFSLYRTFKRCIDYYEITVVQSSILYRLSVQVFQHGMKFSRSKRRLNFLVLANDETRCTRKIRSMLERIAKPNMSNGIDRIMERQS